MQTQDEKLSRRQFFERAMILGAAAAGVGALVACDSPKRSDGAAPAEGDKKAEAPAAGPVCDDQAGVDAAMKANRDTFKYVTQAADPAKPCDACQLFKIGSPCGTCTVVKGPIAPKGGCTAWAPKAT